MTSKRIRAGVGIIGLLLGATFATPALATASTTETKIYFIQTRNDGWVWVRFVEFFSINSVCSQQNTLAFQANTDGGRALLNQVTAAFLAGKSVYATGTAGSASSVCVSGNVDGQAEKMSSIIVLQ